MTTSEIEKSVKEMQAYIKKIRRNPDKQAALKMLHATGMYTEKGNLKKRFK